MPKQELLDEHLSQQLIRKPIFKLLEPALLLGYTFYIIALVYLIGQEEFALQNIFEELIYAVLISICISYIILWRKKSIAADKTQNYELLQDNLLKFWGYICLTIGFFFTAISIFVFTTNTLAINKLDGLQSLIFVSFVFLMGIGQVYYSYSTIRYLPREKG